MLQTDTQGHTSKMAILKHLILESLSLQKANNYAAYTAVLSVCVHWLHILNQLTDCCD